MAHVFLSYDHEDHHFAELVISKLEGADIEVWQDTASIEGGDLWADKIDQAITNCHAIVLILSPNSAVSQYVTYEWSYGMGQGKLVIPLLSNQCKTIHPKIEPRQYLDFSERYSKPWGKLIQRLKKVIEENKGVSPVSRKESNENVITGELVDPNSPIIPSWAKGDHGKDQYGYWAAFTLKGINHKFRWIPPGEFMMGSPETEEGRDDGEVLHLVHIQEGFWLGEFPVTQALYQAVIGENPSHFSDDESSSLLPVEKVSWERGVAFTEMLNSQIPNLNSTLPLETMWEYACRAGSETAFSFGNQISSERANYNGDIGSTTENDCHQANPWGLYDMHGNVWEWCLDIFKADLGSKAVQISTSEELEKIRIRSIKSVKNDQSSAMVLRGGSWNLSGQYCRSAKRFRIKSIQRNDRIGFRLATTEQ